MYSLLLWNVINLIDGEARWFLTFLLVLAVAACTNQAWHWLCQRLHKKFTNDNEYIKDAATQAALLPVSCYIWFLTAIQCIDLVSDRFLSETLSSSLKVVFGTSAVMVLGWFLLRLKKNLTGVLLEKSKSKEIALDPGKVYGISKLLSIIIVVILALLLMEVTGVNVNTLIAFGGISGLAIAFASQEMIANFFGGVMIHINHPFALGDLINIPSSDIEGYVEEIGWYETRLRSKDKQPIYIPNSHFSRSFVINGTRRTHRRIDEIISIRHEDIPVARKIVSDIKKFLDESPIVDSSTKVLVNIDKVGPCSVDIKITCLSIFTDEAEFLHFRDMVLVEAASIIIGHGAEIAIPIEAVLPLEKKG